MKGMIKGLIFLALVVLLIVVATAVFIGAGYLLSLMLPLTLFQSSILCIGATFTLAFIVYVMTINHANNEENDYDEDDEDEEEDEEDEEDTEEKSGNFSNRRLAVINTKKVGRNEPCPCGSGKKYKYCCGKGQKGTDSF